MVWLEFSAETATLFSQRPSNGMLGKRTKRGRLERDSRATKDRLRDSPECHFRTAEACKILTDNGLPTRTVHSIPGHR
jgi:hypothetical protein